VLEHLGELSRAHFEGACVALTALGVPYRVDARLVRGLDYYTGTVFEIIASTAALGTQGTIAAGGRYNGLVESLGGPPTPAVGFALGVERNVLCLAGEPDTYLTVPDAFIVTLGDAARARGLALAQTLRRAGRYVEIEHRVIGMKAQFKRADKIGARAVLTLGDAELAAGTANLRNMKTREERAVRFDDVPAALATLLAG
jgi:histidyl-tRNA synthetase